MKNYFSVDKFFIYEIIYLMEVVKRIFYNRYGRFWLGTITTIAVIGGVFLLLHERHTQDSISTHVSSTTSSSGDYSPYCRFNCNELLRAESTWPTVTTVKTSCNKPIAKCPSSHPEPKQKYSHSSMIRKNNKLLYLWVNEHLCCKK